MTSHTGISYFYPIEVFFRCRKRHFSFDRRRAGRKRVYRQKYFRKEARLTGKRDDNCDLSVSPFKIYYVVRLWLEGATILTECRVCVWCRGDPWGESGGPWRQAERRYRPVGGRPPLVVLPRVPHIPRQDRRLTDKRIPPRSSPLPPVKHLLLISLPPVLTAIYLVFFFVIFI